jgi:GxxExxY protein
MTDKLLHSAITDKILQSFYKVARSLPMGISADIYKKALTIEFEFNSVIFAQDFQIDINYRDKNIGALQADFLIENVVLILVVCEERISPKTEDTARHLLKYSNYELCLILNIFGDREVKRILLTKDFKSTSK